jgi:hypothetical protein
MAEGDEDIAVLFWYCRENLYCTWVKKESVFGCIQLMRKEKRNTRCRIFSRNCNEVKRNLRILQYYP